jgi:hypothetical protein
MDEDFEFFISEFAPMGERQEVPASVFQKYQGVLPNWRGSPKQTPSIGMVNVVQPR